MSDFNRALVGHVVHLEILLSYFERLSCFLHVFWYGCFLMDV